MLGSLKPSPDCILHPTSKGSGEGERRDRVTQGRGRRIMEWRGEMGGGRGKEVEFPTSSILL